jgi:hypothetical protein
MRKSFLDYSDVERLSFAMRGMVGTVSLVYHDQQEYLIYQANGFDELSKEKTREMKALELLENLGFDMDEIGTYLYKDVIAGIAELISDISENETGKKMQFLIESLQNAYSQFYFNLARNERDIGVKTFHSYIEETHQKRDFSKADSNLVFKLYSTNPEEMGSIEQAFLLGNYLASTLVQKGEISKVKQLGNMPSDETK